MMKRSIITLVVALFLVTVTCIPAFAVSGEYVPIPANQVWTKGYGDSHDANYNDAGALCSSVYPYSGVDLFSSIQCRLHDTMDNVISTKDYVVLKEGNGKFTQIEIKDGFIAVPTVYFKFRGNTSSQAQAIVSYVGTLKT